MTSQSVMPAPLPTVQQIGPWIMDSSGCDLLMTCDFKDGDFTGTVCLMSNLTIKPADGSDIREWPIRRYQEIYANMINRYADSVRNWIESGGANIMPEGTN